MSTAIGIETAMLTLARFSLFFACRKYLLRTLYSDLRTLSTTATPGTPNPARQPSSPGIANLAQLNFERDVELESLPLPATHTPSSAKFSIEDATYLHTAVARVIFSWCFSESCMLFTLLMLQGVGVFSSATRLLNWRISLYILMSAILVVIPLSISLFVAIGTTGRSKFLLGPRVLLSLVPVALYLFALSYIPIPPSLETADTTTIVLSRLIVLGTIILGLLSGFGAISSSWQFLPFGSRSTAIPSEQDIDTAQYALTSIRNDMQTRRAEAARRELLPQDSWFSRVGSSFRGNDSLSLELQGLEALEFQMSRNLEALRERREAARYSGTFRGMVFNLIGRLFMAYCMIRIITSFYNVLFLRTRQSSSTTDLITHLLATLLSRISSVEFKTADIAVFARQISLVLVGIIILSSIRLVLRGATRALHITSRNLAASLMLLALAQIMGIYLLSTIVQMRSSFPPPPPSGESGDTNLFSTIPAYEVFGALFDWTFLIAAAVSLFVRWGAERVNGTGNVD